MGMRDVSIHPPIRLSIIVCKISYIGSAPYSLVIDKLAGPPMEGNAPPFWTALVRWYPQ